MSVGIVRPSRGTNRRLYPERIGEWPSVVFEPCEYCLPFNACNCGPFLESVPASLAFKDDCIAILLSPFSSIVGLLFRSRPTGVSRLVISFVADAIKSFPWRTLTHILQKVTETLLPSDADANTSSSVILERWIVTVQASRPHVIPNVKSACSAIYRCSMFFVHGRHYRGSTVSYA